MAQMHYVPETFSPLLIRPIHALHEEGIPLGLPGKDLPLLATEQLACRQNRPLPLEVTAEVVGPGELLGQVHVFDIDLNALPGHLQSSRLRQRGIRAEQGDTQALWADRPTASARGPSQFPAQPEGRGEEPSRGRPAGWRFAWTAAWPYSGCGLYP